MGESLRQMADVKYSLDDNIKQNFLEPLHHLQTKDLKEVMVGFISFHIKIFVVLCKYLRCTVERTFVTTLKRTARGRQIHYSCWINCCQCGTTCVSVEFLFDFNMTTKILNFYLLLLTGVSHSINNFWCYFHSIIVKNCKVEDLTMIANGVDKPKVRFFFRFRFCIERDWRKNKISLPFVTFDLLFTFVFDSIFLYIF